MTSLSSGVKLGLMKKLPLYIFLVLMLSFTITVNAWEKVPVPEYVDKKTKSPWNFYDDFEDKKFNKYIHSSSKNYKSNKNKVGKKPYKFKKDQDGNTYMEVTVKHGWNKCCSDSPADTERAEFSPKYKRTINKEIWYGFRLRFPKDFKHIDDRILITQFKHQFNPMKKSPLFSIHYFFLGNEIDEKYWNKEIDFGGSTGGIAKKYWNKEENIINSVNLKYWKVKKDNKWMLAKFKKRNYAYNNLIRKKIKIGKPSISPSLICNNPNAKAPDCGNDEMIDFNEAICDGIYKPLSCYSNDGKLIPKSKRNELLVDKSSSIKGVKNFKDTNLGEWTTYKIGIRNSKKEDGFVKVYKDNQLIMDYQGITFKWKGNYIGTIIRLGPYRDTDPSGKGYPPQSIHYDDFTIVSDKKTLDQYLK